MATIIDVVNGYIAWEGTLWYRQAEGRKDPDQSGFSDCSGSIWRKFWDVLGIDVGHWTGEQVTRGRTVLSGSNLNGWDESKLQPGDMVLMGSGNEISHVELYVGGGQFSGHGGDVVPGPWRKNARNYIAGWSNWLVKRHVPDMNTNYKPGATAPIKQKDTEMLLIHRPKAAPGGQHLFAVVGPKFWLEFYGQEVANGFARQIGDSVSVSADFWNHCKRSAQTGTNK